MESGQRKAEAPVKPRQALEALPVMALFAIAGKADRDSRGWALQLDKEKRKRPTMKKVKAHPLTTPMEFVNFNVVLALGYLEC